jgi:hypothetical protein
VQLPDGAASVIVGVGMALVGQLFGEGKHQVRFDHDSKNLMGAAYRVSKAGERQGLDRDELYVNLGCLRKCVQVAGI